MYAGSTPFGAQYGAVGITLPEGARVVGTEMQDQIITLHFVADDGATWVDAGLWLAFPGTSVPAGFEHVGMVRRNDGQVLHIFLRRD
jgi:hypothetical protein